MPLFLAGLLIRAGVLTEEGAEAGLRRQALLGGGLDTSLLELGAVDEPTLLAYLAKASGLPPVPAGALDSPAAEVRSLLPARLAERHGVLPFAQAKGEVHLACTYPIEAPLPDELSFLVSRRIVAHVAPELRIRLAMESSLGRPAPTRFHELDRRLAKAPRTDALAGSHGKLEGPPSQAGGWTPEEACARAAAAPSRDDAMAILLGFARQHFELAVTLAIQGNQIAGWDALGPDPDARRQIGALTIPREESALLSLVVESGSPYLGPMRADDGAKRLLKALGREPPRSILVLPITVAGRTVAVLFAENGRELVVPMEVEQVARVAQVVGPALERQIRRRKSNEAPPPPAQIHLGPVVVSTSFPRPLAPPQAAADAADAVVPLAGRADPVGVAMRDEELEAVRDAVEQALLAVDPADRLRGLGSKAGIAAELLVALLPGGRLGRQTAGEFFAHPVARALESLGPLALPALRPAAASSVPAIRREVAWLLRRCGPGADDPALALLVSDEDPDVAAAARGA